jgi:hypothetical protein
VTTYDEIQPLLVGGWSDDAQAKIAEHLDLVADIDLAEPDYSFDLLRIYLRRADGMLLWATDSGCSCPSPFEDTKVSDLRESTAATLLDTFMGEWEEEVHYSGYPAAKIRRAIADAVREAVNRGAR